MDKDTFLERIKEIGTCDDEVKRREILSEVSDEISKIYDINNDLSSTNETLKNDIEKVRETNMQLFLKVEGQKTEKEPDVVEEPTERLRFEDLFNEKGMIK